MSLLETSSFNSLTKTVYAVTVHRRFMVGSSSFPLSAPMRSRSSAVHLSTSSGGSSSVFNDDTFATEAMEPSLMEEEEDTEEERPLFGPAVSLMYSYSSLLST